LFLSFVWLFFRFFSSFFVYFFFFYKKSGLDIDLWTHTAAGTECFLAGNAKIWGSTSSTMVEKEKLGENITLSGEASGTDICGGQRNRRDAGCRERGIKAGQ